MAEIDVIIKEKEKNYPIIIKEGLRDEINQLLTDRYHDDKILLVTDKNVMYYYGSWLKEILEESPYEVLIYQLIPGEKAKTFQTLKDGYDLLIKNKFKRNNLIIAFGGGVVGDVAGFLAATFMRGIRFIQIPTTLLAQVDSSIGGKTAINHSAGKNLIGSFYQPELVIIDPFFLKTLPKRELKTGMAEIIKTGLIADFNLVSYLLEKKDLLEALDIGALSNVIYRSCKIKSKIIIKDEKEEGIRALLNYGHTIGHALEAATNFEKYHHGEAVAIGMVGAARLSNKAGYLDDENHKLIKGLLKEYGLPVSFQYDEAVSCIYEKLFYDKKSQNDRLRWVLLDKIGHAFLEDNLKNQLVRETLEELK